MATVPTASAQSSTPTAPLSQGTRIINTFVAPSTTFTDIRRSASWWLPFLLITIATVAFSYTVDKKVGYRRVAENQIQLSAKQAARMEQMSAPERERAISMQAIGTRYFMYYGLWLFLLILYVVVAAVLFATFKFGANATLTFKATLAVVIYASVPGILRSLLAIVSLFAGANADSFMLQSPVATNPAYFMSAADSPVLYAVASSLDIFMIWTLILTAIGLTCISNLKRSTAMFGVFGWYAFTTLLSIVRAAFA